MKALPYVSPKYREARQVKPTLVASVRGCTLTPEQLKIAKKLADRLRELRVRAGLKQADVARKSGIARPNVVRLETGRHHVPSVESVVRYCRAIGAQPSEVFSVLDEVSGA